MEYTVNSFLHMHCLNCSLGSGGLFLGTTRQQSRKCFSLATFCNAQMPRQFLATLLTA